MRGAIVSLNDIKVWLAKYSNHGYHIDFDKEGRVLVFLHPLEYAELTRGLYASMPVGLQSSVKVLELSWWKQLKNWLTRSQRHFA